MSVSKLFQYAKEGDTKGVQSIIKENPSLVDAVNNVSFNAVFKIVFVYPICRKVPPLFCVPLCTEILK